jgi:two-component system response regulator RegA
VLGQVGVATSPQEKTLLIVDDDKSFATRLGRAMEARGFDVRMADGVQDGLSAIRNQPPAYAAG